MQDLTPTLMPASVPEVTFTHQPLHDVNNIRLLRCFTSYCPQSPICCEIAEFARNYAPMYNAISYTWGDSAQKRRIWCCYLPPASTCVARATVPRSFLNVTVSCEEALRLMRSHDHGQSSWLWIDSVCINQSDVVERNSQVALMALTYRAAEEVVACLNNVVNEGLNGNVERRLHTRLLASRMLVDLTTQLLSFRWLVRAASLRSSELAPIVQNIECIEYRLQMMIKSLTGQEDTFEVLAQGDRMMRLMSELAGEVGKIKVPDDYELNAYQQQTIENLSGYWQLDRNGLILPFGPDIMRDLSILERRMVLSLLNHAQETAKTGDEFLESIASHKWFTRLWVVEEFGLSKNLSFLVGSLRMTWMELRRHLLRIDLEPYLMKLIERRVRGHDYVQIQARPCSKNDVFSGSWRHLIRTSIKEYDVCESPELMESTRKFECADLRDKLFAVLPLFRRPYPILFSPDYRKSEAQVFIDGIAQLVAIGEDTVGLTSRSTTIGDSVCYVFGHRNPFVLRQANRSWRLIDECFLIADHVDDILETLNCDQVVSQRPEYPLQDFEIR